MEKQGIMGDARQNLSGKTVVVGFTGRTDSALAAFLLKKQGMQVIGLSIVTVDEDIVRDKSELPKCHITNLENVKKLCEHLKIPFYATNAKPKFESQVIDRIVSSKLTGQANSSCFYCSQTRMEILFEKAQALGADYIATGHYAKVRRNLASKAYYIHSSADESSDQSFLLAGTPSRILDKLLLPLGDLSKKEIERYAKHFSLPVDPSVKQQGFCFRSKKSSYKILESRLPKSFIRPGQVENAESGNSAAEHSGMVYHYITEKEPVFKNGVHIDRRLEITGYDYKSAVIYVGEPKLLEFEGTQLTRARFNFGMDFSAPITVYVKFKYSGRFIKSELFFKNNNTVLLEFKEKVYPLIPGEVLVAYDSDNSNSRVLGWGQVALRGTFNLINRVAKYEAKPEEEEEGGADQASSLFRF